MKFPFTKAAIIAAAPGTYRDAKQPGLYAYVTPTSRKYGVYVSIRNNPIRRSLGNVADQSVEAARAEAARIIHELRETPKQRQKKLLSQFYTFINGVVLAQHGLQVADQLHCLCRPTMYQLSVDHPEDA